MKVRSANHDSPVLQPVDLAARTRLAAHLRDQLAQVEVEVPSYEELEAYVDGRLSPVDAEAFATRLEDDALLAAEVADLERLRDQLARRRGTAVARPVPVLPRWIWVAAAALAIAVAGTVAERSLAPRRPAVSPSSTLADTQTPAAPERPSIFVDGFETGSTAAWQAN
jgi:hypothetical protein